MSNWATITSTDVEQATNVAIINAVEGIQPGCTAGVITDVIARIRAAIAVGNQLDQDKTKIPNSLKDLAARMVVRRLTAIARMDLSTDERDQRKEDNAYLLQISTDKIRFETPDTPAGSGEMQESGSMLEQQTGAAIEGQDPQVFTREKMQGL